MADSNVTMIPIVAGYYYSIDSLHNHTLYYKEMREVKKLGNNSGGTGKFKEFMDVLGYYPNMTWLLKALVKDSAYRKIEAGEIKKVEDYLSALEDMTQRIESILIEKP